MTCAAYTVTRAELKPIRFIEAVDKLAIVVGCVVTNKTVKLGLEVVLSDNVEY